MEKLSKIKQSISKNLNDLEEHVVNHKKLYGLILAIALLSDAFMLFAVHGHSAGNELEMALSRPAILEPCFPTSSAPDINPTPYIIPTLNPQVVEAQNQNATTIQATQNAMPTPDIPAPIPTVEPDDDKIIYESDELFDKYASAVANLVFVNESVQYHDLSSTVLIFDKDENNISILADNHGVKMMSGITGKQPDIFYLTSFEDKANPENYGVRNGAEVLYEMTKCEYITQDEVILATLMTGKKVDDDAENNNIAFGTDQIGGPCGVGNFTVAHLPRIEDETRPQISIFSAPDLPKLERTRIVQTGQTNYGRAYKLATYYGSSGAKPTNEGGNVCGVINGINAIGDEPGLTSITDLPNPSEMKPLLEEFIKGQ